MSCAPETVQNQNENTVGITVIRILYILEWSNTYVYVRMWCDLGPTATSSCFLFLFLGSSGSLFEKKTWAGSTSTRHNKNNFGSFVLSFQKKVKTMTTIFKLNLSVGFNFRISVRKYAHVRVFQLQTRNILKWNWKVKSKLQRWNASQYQPHYTYVHNSLPSR